MIFLFPLSILVYSFSRPVRALHFHLFVILTITIILIEIFIILPLNFLLCHHLLPLPPLRLLGYCILHFFLQCNFSRRNHLSSFLNIDSSPYQQVLKLKLFGLNSMCEEIQSLFWKGKTQDMFLSSWFNNQQWLHLFP